MGRSILLILGHAGLPKNLRVDYRAPSACCNNDIDTFAYAVLGMFMDDWDVAYTSCRLSRCGCFKL